MAREGEGTGLQVELCRFGGDIGGRDCEGDVVSFGVAVGGTLGPEDWMVGEERLA